MVGGAGGAVCVDFCWQVATIMAGIYECRVRDSRGKPVKVANKKGVRDIACNFGMKILATCGLGTDSPTAKAK